MIIFTFLINILFVITQSRRRYRGGGGRGAGIGKVTQTFGQGVASLIKDIKQGNWGEQQYQEFDEKKGNRFKNDAKYRQQIGDDTTFYILVVCATILIVIGILYFIIKILPKWNEQNTVQQMKKRNAQRFKHYEAVKLISQTGIHPDKAFGRLQKIKYK